MTVATETVVRRCSKKFRKIHRKTPVPDLFFNKAAGLLRTPFFIEHLSCFCCKTYLLHTLLRFSSGKTLKNFINFLQTMLKDFQVKTISKDVAAPANLLKKRL